MHECARVNGREAGDRQRGRNDGRRGDEAERAVADDGVAGEQAIEHLRREHDRREDADHGELLRIADRRGDACFVENLQQWRVSSEREDRGDDRDQQHEPPTARSGERASDTERDREQARVHAEQKRRPHSRIQPAAPVPHHMLHGNVPEDVGIDQLREFCPGHTPRRNQIELERPRARGVVHMVDCRNDLRRADREPAERDECDPRDVRQRLGNPRGRVPSAIQRVETDQQTCLHHSRGLADEKLNAEKKRGCGEVAHSRPEQEAPDEKACQRQPSQAKQNR